MFSWEFSNKKNHGASWYIGALIVLLVLVIYGIISQIYILSIVTLLFAGTYVLMENNSTPTTQVTLNDTTVQIDATVYELETFESFAIIRIENTPKILRFIPKKKLSNQIDIPLGPDVNPQELKKYLAERLTEDSDAKMSGTDTLIQVMKL